MKKAPADGTKVKKTRKPARSSAEWHSRQLALLYELCTNLTSILDEEELLSRAVIIINNYFNFAVVAINLVDEPNEHLHLAAFSSSLQQDLSIGNRVEFGQGVVGQAAKDRKPILVTDTQKCDFYIEKFQATRSELACPIIRGEHLLGVLNLESDLVDTFTPDDVKAVEILAGTLAIAIENARAFDRVQELNRTKDMLLERLSHDYQNIFESMMQGMGRLTPEGRFLIVNPALARILNYPSPEYLLKLEIPRDIFPFPEQWPKLIDALERGDSVTDWEAQFKKRDGQIIDVKINARRMCEDAGSSVYYDAVIEDVSERKRLQQELQRRERMSTMGELAAMIAHEIRNPLAAVLNSAEEIQARIDTSGTESIVFTGTNRRLLEIILEEAERLERIVHDFLNFARPSQPKFASADINQILEKTLGLVMQGQELRPDIRIEKQLTFGLPMLNLDAGLIIQVFLNVIMNAAQAIRGSGTIRVRTALEPHQFEPDWVGENFVVAEVIDSGSGIRGRDQDRIFEPFFTTKPSGTGLGLPIAKQIVDMHGGSISVQSQEGSGTTVRVLLPTSRF
jgi:PAS domain S-box-containing protein